MTCNNRWWSCHLLVWSTHPQVESGLYSLQLEITTGQLLQISDLLRLIDYFIICPIAIAQHGTDNKIAGVCLSVCMSVTAPAVAILNRIWWNFAQSFGVKKEDRVRCGSKSDNTFPVLPPIFLNFTTPNAFSMGRSKHCSMDARWPITSHTAHRWLLGYLTENGTTPMFPPKTPQNCNQCSYNGEYAYPTDTALYLSDDARYTV